MVGESWAAWPNVNGAGLGDASDLDNPCFLPREYPLGEWFGDPDIGEDNVQLG